MLIKAILRWTGRLDMDLVVVGDGPQSHELGHLLRASVLDHMPRFVGWLPEPD